MLTVVVSSRRSSSSSRISPLELEGEKRLLRRRLRLVPGVVALSHHAYVVDLEDAPPALAKVALAVQVHAGEVDYALGPSAAGLWVGGGFDVGRGGGRGEDVKVRQGEGGGGVHEGLWIEGKVEEGVQFGEGRWYRPWRPLVQISCVCVRVCVYVCMYECMCVSMSRVWWLFGRVVVTLCVRGENIL